MATRPSAFTHSAVGASGEIQIRSSIHTWQTTVTGSPTAVTILLQGSIDKGVTWFAIDTSTSTTGETRHVVNKLVTSLRTNLTVLTAGTAPTVTSNVVSQENL